MQTQCRICKLITHPLHFLRELIKETIDTRALAMQSTVKKYKADLATAENTVTDLNQKVPACSLMFSNMYGSFSSK